MFSPEDLLLHLAFHLTTVTGFVGQVRTLCDIGELCRRYRETLEWSQLVGPGMRLTESGKPLYYALRLAQELVGAGVPSRALRDLKASFGQLPLEERLITTVARRALLSEDQPTDPLLVARYARRSPAGNPPCARRSHGYLSSPGPLVPGAPAAARRETLRRALHA